MQIIAKWQSLRSNLTFLSLLSKNLQVDHYIINQSQ